MPTRPPRVCSACGNAVSGRCPCKPRSGWEARPASSWASGSTRRWRRFRDAWLAEHPMCAGYGGPCRALAEQVDHKMPLGQFRAGREREAARYDRSNVQSLCVPCHRRKTNDEANATRGLRRTQEKTGQLW